MGGPHSVWDWPEPAVAGAPTLTALAPRSAPAPPRPAHVGALRAVLSPPTFS